MISFIFGTPGSGKTSCGVWLARRALSGKPLKVGRMSLQDNSTYTHVYTNFPCLGCYQVEPSDLGTIDLSHSLLIFDEVAQIWDARNFKAFCDTQKYFFALHRHYFVDIILISQGYADADLRIRNLCNNLLLLTPSFYHFSKLTPIYKYARLEQGQILEGYEKAPIIDCRYFNRKKTYPFYDSYSAPVLPSRPPSLWVWGNDGG